MTAPIIIALFHGYPSRGDLNAFCDRHGLAYFDAMVFVERLKKHPTKEVWLLTFSTAPLPPPILDRRRSVPWG
jgi:hypothetical protein